MSTIARHLHDTKSRGASLVDQLRVPIAAINRIDRELTYSRKAAHWVDRTGVISQATDKKINYNYMPYHIANILSTANPKIRRK